jgi:glycerophosphoryl diester phosphodiesterase
MTYGFAHRGGAPGPENTLASFAAALAMGAGGLETDAWLSRDGAVVLDHDGVGGVDRNQRIADLRRDELPAHIPTIDELYTACGTDYELAIDVKAPAIADAVAAAAQRFGAADRLWVVAPAASYLARLSAGHRVMTVRGNVLRSGRRRAAFSAARAAGIEVINARWLWWTGSLVDEVHAMGMRAFGYDAQKRVSLDRSLGIGLDGIFSDHVDRMLAAIDRGAG